MAFHIPFEHRNRNRHHIGPIYIGFDPPAPPRKKFNWWGFHGLWMSLASFISLGFLSPIPLLISWVGLKREGKKMAMAGTVFSLLGIGLASAVVVGGIASENHREYLSQLRHNQRVTAKKVNETEKLLVTASEELEQYSDSHDGKLPSWIDCNMLMIKYEDPWGKSLRFDADAEDWGTLRSAGADSKFDTKDDVSVRIDGETDRATLLDLD